MKAFAYIRPVFRERSIINADVTGRLTETLGGIRVIKGFNAEAIRRSKVFEKGVHRLFTNVKKSLSFYKFTYQIPESLTYSDLQQQRSWVLVDQW